METPPVGPAVPPESPCAAIIQSAKTKPKFAALLSAIGNIDVQCVDCSQYGTEGNAKALIRIDPLAIQICQVLLIPCRHCLPSCFHAYLILFNTFNTFQNKNLNEKDIETSLVHELVHAYDYKLKRYDMFTCDGLAASEVRAAREAECSGEYPLQWLRDRCIRQRATASTANLFPPLEASKSVEKVFASAVADVEPLQDSINSHS